ncbi:MAG: hypothetical protein H8E86_02235 [Planctomycetes bacterium]|nr:hypothetical protein [Planctomycetota bacterium]
MITTRVQDAIEEVASLLKVDGCISAGSTSGSFACFASSFLVRNKGVLFVTAHHDDADETVAMFHDLGIEVELFPALESEVAKELVATRFAVLEHLAASDSPRVVVASIAALMQMTPSPSQVKEVVLRIGVGETWSLSELQQWLVDAGFERRESIEDQAQFAIRGGILDIATAAGEFFRLDFFGDTIESINEVDPVSLGSDLAIDEIILASAKRTSVSGTIVDHIPHSWSVILDDIEEITQQANSYFGRVPDASELSHIDDTQAAMVKKLSSVLALSGPPADGVEVALPVTALPLFSTVVSEAYLELVALSEHREVLLACRTSGEAQRMRELMEAGQPLASAKNLHIEEQFVHRGFLLSEHVAVVPSHEVFHRYEVRRGVRAKQKTMRQAIAHFDFDDIVVHRDYGIARYLGLKILDGRGEIEHITLEFASHRLLHVPATHANLVQRYVGAFKGKPELSALGGTKWAKSFEVP